MPDHQKLNGRPFIATVQASKLLSMKNIGKILFGALAVFSLVVPSHIHPASAADDVPTWWKAEFPTTDFSKHSVPFKEIFSGGPPKDGIPSIDEPKFVLAGLYGSLAATEPVIGLMVNGDARAYPLRILMWHEIVNDEIGGVPVTVTYCPLCNSSIVFDRRVGDRVLDFGTTGRLRNSDMVMYDRQTESWWQQFLGEAVIGALTGTRLKTLPARLESFENFKKRAPKGQVLVPNDGQMRDYGRNPYAFYDSRSTPYDFFQGPFPDYIDPMVRVVVVGQEAWAMPLIRNAGTVTKGDLTLKWTKGQNSALDTGEIAKGKDVGNIVVQRIKDGRATDVVYDVTFAFVYTAFHPGNRIITE